MKHIWWKLLSHKIMNLQMLPALLVIAQILLGTDGPPSGT